MTKIFPTQAAPMPARPFAALACALLIALSACTERSAESTARGAASGSIAGAVGGLISGLVFGGNAAESAARGAVYGGSVGAVSGAIQGSAADSAAAKQREAEENRIRAKIGEDAFAGLRDLAECRHREAIAQARKAQSSETAAFALAGQWLEVLALADQRKEPEARARFPVLVKLDGAIADDYAAERKMRDGLERLREIRKTYKLPMVCKA